MSETLFTRWAAYSSEKNLDEPAVFTFGRNLGLISEFENYLKKENIPYEKLDYYIRVENYYRVEDRKQAWYWQ